uniref:Uncharacterized protein n=1 Tax=Schlesneria paludicola TaxID=360056 RepID=A0A7C4QMT0_9PLAN
MNTPTTPAAAQRTHWLTWLFAALVLIPTILGFGNKFLDLVLVIQGDEEGAFAATPIVNYLFATAGFFCLLLWSAAQGAFHDLDRPSREMFENEQRLDAHENVQPAASAESHA